MAKLNLVGPFSFLISFIILLSLLTEAFTASDSDSQESFSYSKHRSSKMTVCTADGNSYTFSTKTCKNGAWIPQGIDIECVCVTGLWAISEEYCSNDFLLVAGGRPECFKVNKRIRRIISLYNPFDPRDAKKALIVRGNLEEVEIFDGSIDTKGNDDGAYVLRFNETENQMYMRHTEGYHDKFWQSCVKPSRQQNLYQIVRANGITYANNIKGCRLSQDMDYPMKKINKTVWGLSPGQSWHPIRGVEKKSTKCDATCKPRMRRGARTSRQITGGGGIPDEDGGMTEDQANKLRETLAKATSSLGNFDSVEEPLMNRTAEPFDKIDMDTSKIANYLRNWNLKRESGPKLPYKAYKYLQYARMILIKTCPNEDVPPVVVSDFLRLFRYVIHESLRKSPESYSDDINESAHKRIVKTLETCFNSAKQIQFYLGDTCPKKIAKGTYDDKTVNTDLLPDYLITNRNKSDIVLEAIWKMVLHTHYLCSEHFSKNGADLSTMYMKLQEFFTDSHAMFRWEHPMKRTNKIYSILFPSLDFKRFAAGMDACLATSQGVAKYSAWLRRPTSNHQKTSKIMARKMTKVSASGRSLNSLPTLFDNKGYCTHAFNDPIRWTKFNKEIDATCVKNSFLSENEAS